MSDVLIIGGGVSGLSAGIAALKKGHKVVLCEQHVCTGGNLTAWNRKGYVVDNCIHWLTGTNKANKMYKMWEFVGALSEDVEIIKPPLLYTVEHEGDSLSLFRDLDMVVAKMFEISPEDQRQIKSFYRAVTAVQGLLHNGGPGKNESLPLGQLIASVPAVLKYITHNTGEIANKFKHPLLKKYFTYLMGTEHCAFDFAYVTATFVGANADLPRGMSKGMAERMEKTFLKLGGELHTKKEASKFNVTNGHITSVSFTDGDEMKADAVISAIDPLITFNRLLGGMPLPKKLQKQYKNRGYKKFSSYHIEYAVSLPKVPFRENLFIDTPMEYRDIIGNHRIMLREFSLEPSFAKEGTSNIQVMIYCWQEGADKFIELREQDRKAYEERKRELEAAVREIIVRRFPEFEGKLEMLDMWTPATIKRYTGAESGAYMSFINPKLTAPTDIDYKVKGIDNLIMASQWQISPGGLPNAADAGIKAAAHI